jgi:protein TonB
MLMISSKQRFRFVRAFMLSLLINLAMVFGLGRLHAEDLTRLPDQQILVPMNIVEMPPTPEPTESKESTSKIDATLTALPPLELPTESANMGGIEIPKTDADNFGWALDARIPEFTGRVGKGLGGTSLSITTPPVLLYQPDLAMFYPGRARRAKISGKTQLLLDIDASGEVAHIQIKQSIPEGVFERAARRAAKKLRYKASVRNGRPQSSKVSMEFIWTLD